MYSSFGCVVIFISVVGSEKTFKRTTAVPGSLAFLFSFVFIYLLILSLCGSKISHWGWVGSKEGKTFEKNETPQISEGWETEEKERKVRKKKSV